MAISSVGSRIRARRERLGWKQRDLARACNLDSVTVWKYEHERTRPSPETAVRLAEALRVSLDWLFTGRESNHRTVAARPVKKKRASRVSPPDSDRRVDAISA